MISYIIQPNRFYPFLEKKIKEKYKVNHYYNHLIINDIPHFFDYDTNKIEKINIFDILKIKNNCDFFCGVMHPRYNSLLKPTLTFSIIAHPIERVYDFYHLCKIIETKTSFSVNNLIQNIFNQENLTLENFIDTIIENNLFKTTSLKLEEHILSIPESFKNFDFIGISEHPESTVKFFKSQFDINIDDCDLSIKNNVSTYRKTELETLLAKELDLYFYFLNKTKNL